MNLLKFVWTANRIIHKVDAPTQQGEENTLKGSPEAPTQECEAARRNLLGVIASSMELPLHWLGTVNKETGHIEEGTDTVKPYGIIVSHTSKGTRSASVMFTKRYISGKSERYKTPLLQFDDPAEGETEECGFAEVERCKLNSMVENALAYVGGVRQKKSVKFIEHGSIPEDPKQDAINFNEDADPSVVDAAEKLASEKAVKKAKPRSTKRAGK